MEQQAKMSPAPVRDARALSYEITEIFLPSLSAKCADTTLFNGDRRLLWSTDAIHRANNLAQMATAVAHFHARTPPCPENRTVEFARALAAAYVELAKEHQSTAVPCADLLTRVAQGLIDLLGGKNRLVILRCQVNELDLPCEHRRALVLITSELVVNAMKYAFGQDPGTIGVTLTVSPSHAELSVEDDGVGLGSDTRSGSGSRIVDEMAELLGAFVTRANGLCGGLRVSVTIPLEHC